MNGLADSQLALQFYRVRMNGHDANGIAPSSTDLSPFCMALNNGAAPERPSNNVESNHRSSVDAKKMNVTSSVTMLMLRSLLII